MHCIVSKLGCFNLFAKVRQLYNASAPLSLPIGAFCREMKEAGFAKVQC